MKNASSLIVRSCLALAALVGSATVAAAQSTAMAQDLVDSVGVNVHLHYDDTLYGQNFPLVRSRLLELGIRHVRDGMVDTQWQEYYDRHNTLGRAGIDTLFIVAPNTPTAVLENYPTLTRDTFAGYEGPNEYNWSGDPDWVSTLRSTMHQLFALKQNPRLAHFPIVAPSLTEASAYTRLGDISALVDAGNLHNYMAGRHPGTIGWGDDGYGSIDWNLGLVKRIIGSKPIVSTETGYWDDPALIDALPDEIVGRYLPRLVLEQFRKGISRTYLYELIDFPVAGLGDLSGYGLLTKDGTPKPAYKALKGLLRLLADTEPVTTPKAIDYHVRKAADDVRHMAFQKSGGIYHIAIWQEQQGYDVNMRTPMPVKPQTVQVVLPAGVKLRAIRRWNPDGTTSNTPQSGQTGTLSFTVTDRLAMIMVEDTNLSSAVGPVSR